jgi:hypothetical protein
MLVGVITHIHLPLGILNSSQRVYEGVKEKKKSPPKVRGTRSANKTVVPRSETPSRPNSERKVLAGVHKNQAQLSVISTLSTSVEVRRTDTV